MNFVQAWKNALDACSFDLLKLLINKRNSLSKTLSETKVHELELIHRKKYKLVRDRDDKTKGFYRPWARKIESHKPTIQNPPTNKISYRCPNHRDPSTPHNQFHPPRPKSV